MGVRRIKRTRIWEEITFDESNPEQQPRSADTVGPELPPAGPGTPPGLGASGHWNTFWRSLWIALRILGILFLPVVYGTGNVMIELDYLDKLILFSLTLLSIGLLFPNTRDWVSQFNNRLGQPESESDKELEEHSQ